MGHRQNIGVDMETSPSRPTPLYFSFFLFYKTFQFQETRLPQIVPDSAHPRGYFHTGLFTGLLGRATKQQLSLHIENLFSNSERSFKKPTQFPLKRNSFYAPA